MAPAGSNRIRNHIPLSHVLRRRNPDENRLTQCLVKSSDVKRVVSDFHPPLSPSPKPMACLIRLQDANTEVVLLGDFLRELVQQVQAIFWTILKPKGSIRTLFRAR